MRPVKQQRNATQQRTATCSHGAGSGVNTVYALCLETRPTHGTKASGVRTGDSAVLPAQGAVVTGVARSHHQIPRTTCTQHRDAESTSGASVEREDCIPPVTQAAEKHFFCYLRHMRRGFTNFIYASSAVKGQRCKLTARVRTETETCKYCAYCRL